MATTKKTVADYQAQEQKLLAMAAKRGLDKNFLFTTTLARYKMQIEIMQSLEVAIKEYGNIVTKEYVKGRENICINPAISEYNRTSTAANNTLASLINVLKSVEPEPAPSKLDKLLEDDDE